MTGDTESLITQASQGDDGAIGALLERHLPALRAYIRLRMGPRIRRWETVSDVCQSACREVLRGLDNFNYQGEAAFRQWLFTAALRKLVEKDRFLGAAKRDTDRLETDAPGSAPGRDRVAEEVCRAAGSPSQLAVGHEMQTRIEQALDAIPEDAREVFLMSRLAGLSNPEIAKLTGKTESTVCTLLSRTVARLSRIVVE